jgi:prolyl-tRNA synthetase
MKKFAGHIIGVDNKSDDTTQDEDVLLEVTDTHKDGMIEIGMDDRNERFYVRFRLQDLVAAVMANGVSDE